MNDVVIVGAGGQVGRVFRDFMPNWTYLDRKQLDLSKPQLIKKFFSGVNRPKIIINCAAYTAVDKAETFKEEAHKINAQAVGELAQSCENFIHFSTDYVFDGTKSTPYMESDPPCPINFYGQTKWEGEKLAIGHNPNSYIIRTSWVYSKYGVNFVKRMIELAKIKPELKVVNDQLGCPTWVNDLVRAVLLIVRNSENITPGIYNYSNEGQCTWFELARETLRLCKLNVNILPISTAEFPTPAPRPKYSVLSKQKIRDAIPVELPNWQNSLASMLSTL